MRENPQQYDPGWLVDFVSDQPKLLAEYPWLLDALRSCTMAVRESDAMIHFVNPASPNQPGSEWQFEKCIFLEHPVEGDIVLDILHRQRVGGVEFIGRIE